MKAAVRPRDVFPTPRSPKIKICLPSELKARSICRSFVSRPRKYSVLDMARPGVKWRRKICRNSSSLNPAIVITTLPHLRFRESASNFSTKARSQADGRQKFLSGLSSLIVSGGLNLFPQRLPFFLHINDRQLSSKKRQAISGRLCRYHWQHLKIAFARLFKALGRCGCYTVRNRLRRMPWIRAHFIAHYSGAEVAARSPEVGQSDQLARELLLPRSHPSMLPPSETSFRQN